MSVAGSISPAAAAAAAAAASSSVAHALAAVDSCAQPAAPTAVAPVSAFDEEYLLHQYCHDDPKKLNDFRLAELDALCQIAGVPAPCYNKQDVVYNSAFLVARFPSPHCIPVMAARSILVKSWCELWATGATVDECLVQFAQRRAVAAAAAAASGGGGGADSNGIAASIAALAAQADLIFDVRVVAVGITLSPDEKRVHRSAALSALSFAAPPCLGHNDLRSGAKLVLFLDVGTVPANPARGVRRVFLARVVCEDANDLEQRYRLNARACIGPTSMPPSLSFIMANLALVRRGAVVLDAFVGTGSLLVSAGHFGALCVGTDLDHKLLHGKTRKGPATVLDNFKQYKFAPPEILCADLNHRVWRGDYGSSDASCPTRGLGWVDAIVSDPPYGVRAGARKLGRAPDTKKLKADDGRSVPSNLYVIATQLYEVDQVVTDLLALAADVLRVGGRLVYWLPTPGDGEGLPRAPLAVPAHPALRLVSVCEQAVRLAFNRALVCMEKTCENTPQLRRQYEEEQAAATAAAASAADAAAAVDPALAAPSSAPTAAAASVAASTPPISANHAKRLAKVAFRQQRKAMQLQAASGVPAASTPPTPADQAQ